MTVRLFKSSEVGAPQMSTTTPGDLLTILRACLVEGFGTRTSAGWTMPFSDLPNKIACFKSVSGDTLRLDDSDDYRWASVLGFKTMSDLNTGTEQYPSAAQLTNNQEWRVSKRYSSSSRYNAWLLVASDNWFYFIGLHDDSYPFDSAGFFFGEFESLNPLLTGNHVITGQRATVGSSALDTATLYSPDKSLISRRNYQESLNPTWLYHIVYRPNHKQPNPVTGALEFDRTWITDNNTERSRYGYFPNHHHLISDDNQEYRGGEVFESSGKKYVMIANNYAAYALEYELDEL